MKRVLIFSIFLLFPSIVFSEEQIYYCTDDEIVGFDPSKNYKLQKFNPLRFSIKINFTKPSLVSEKILFPTEGHLNDLSSCLFHVSKKNIIYCTSVVGSTFSFNKNNSRFHRSNLYNKNNNTDDIFISHGSCEKF